MIMKYVLLVTMLGVSEPIELTRANEYECERSKTYLLASQANIVDAECISFVDYYADKIERQHGGEL